MLVKAVRREREAEHDVVEERERHRTSKTIIREHIFTESRSLATDVEREEMNGLHDNMLIL